ncbi:hypothetical protein ACYATP_02425 [Lactobacillaceae bacterium Melli_B4]
MDKIDFNNYWFEYDPTKATYLMDESSLIFIHLNSSDVMINIAMVDNQITLTPGLDVTVEQSADNYYRLICNEYNSRNEYS